MVEIFVVIALIIVIVLIMNKKNAKPIKQMDKQPIRRKQPPRNPIQTETKTPIIKGESNNDVYMIDYDGRHIQDAIKYRDLGRVAFKEGRNNDAWNYFSMESEEYAKHAEVMGFSAINTICLCNSVGEARANILRVEGKHLDAFFHIFLWVATSKHRKIKKHDQKLQAYFNRCKFKKLTLDEVKAYLNELEAIDSSNIINQFQVWRDNEK